MLPRENLNFQNLRNAIFWHSGTDVCIITDSVTTRLEGNFLGVTLLYTPYFSPGASPPPFEAIFFGVDPLKSHQPNPPQLH